MDPQKADTLIKKIWTLDNQLKAIQKDLSEIEYAIADEIPEDQ